MIPDRIFFAIIVLTVVAIWIQLVKALRRQAQKQDAAGDWSRPPQTPSRAAAINGLGIRPQNTSSVQRRFT